ncbi:hypothetical protein HYH03_011531 [Edaphochlamys debaryana]|uniref:SAM domain-containing protein n=1 Tax=Edaphochlamys debaryana TaxID=47281 RepID=A0A835XTY2_9CHLO|nr:hypothetical protein HYH03_011531 [Edaphochlamys debaryana]|eukprot:KAG2490066.1 hypothetical protein HYH03_011531 [Edaphochlamys debaryana]
MSKGGASASIDFSESAVQRTPSVAGSARAPSVAGSARAPSVAGSARPSSRLTSEKNFGGADEDPNASIAFSDAASERPSRAGSQAATPRQQSLAGSVKAPSLAGSARAPSFAGSAKPGASTSIALDGDDDNASIAFSDAASDRPSKPKSVAGSAVPSARPSASGVSGLGSRKPSGLGGAGLSIQENTDEGNASIAFSDLNSERGSKPKSTATTPAAPGSTKAPSRTISRLASEKGSDLGDLGASISYSDAGSERPSKARSTATTPAVREPSVAGSAAGSISVKRSTPSASAAGTPKSGSKPARSAAGDIEIDGDDADGNISLSYSALGDDNASVRSGASKKPPAAPGSVSGLSAKSSGVSLRPPGVKSSKAGSAAGGSDEDGDKPAPSASNSDASLGLSLSGSVAHSASITGSVPAPKRSAPSASACARRSASARSSAAAPAGGSSDGGGYSDDGFDEEDAKTSAKTSRAASRTTSRAASTKSRTAPPVEDEPVDEDEPATATPMRSSLSASGTPATPSGGGAPPGGVSGAISTAGSIFQARSSAGGGGGGEATPTPSSRKGSVFKRLPADAPDDSGAADGEMPPSKPPLSRTGSTRSARSERPPSASPGSAAGDSWDEGAIRVPPPGAPRPFSGRRDDGLDGGPSGGRPRPLSAAPRDRAAAALDSLTRKHPATWDPQEVATWVDFIGLGQYRRRFLHHLVDGRLLLRLTDSQLKSELAIGPLGHRQALLEAAATVVKNYEEAAAEKDGDEGGEGRTDAPARRRPFSAAAGGGGALTASPPGGPRRPASASRSVIPPDNYLGPALGKVTVYEQRARLLFDLDRAQARAEQHRALAEQLQHNANLSKEEVAHIRGMLQDIEKKNRAAFGATGTAVDSSARIPWRHVGPGSKHNNWASERFARPGDPDSVDMTFQPRINPASKRMLGGGGGGEYGEAGGNKFLDRLNNDLRKREGARKELERRYYPEFSGPGGAAPINPAQSDAEFSLLKDALRQRCHIELERNPEDYEGQIDECIDSLSKNENWREAGLKAGPIHSARGPAKVAAAMSALRSLAFMERYRSDLRAKNGRMKALEKKWLTQTLGAQYLPGAKDREDLDQAVSFFALLGWRGDDGEPSEPAITDELLDRLIDRALEYRVRYDNWWERVRDKPEERSAGFECDVDWVNDPRWASDGLAPLMQAEMDRLGEGMEGTKAREMGGTLTQHAPPTDIVEVSPMAVGGMDFVEFTVKLLGKSRADDLKRLKPLTERPKRLGVYRAIRTQKFIEFTQRDLEERNKKIRQAYASLVPPKRQLAPTRIDGFFERLMEDGAKRRAKAEKAAHDRMAKEAEILASSVMYSRPRSAR